MVAFGDPGDKRKIINVMFIAVAFVTFIFYCCGAGAKWVMKVESGGVSSTDEISLYNDFTNDQKIDSTWCSSSSQIDHKTLICNDIRAARAFTILAVFASVTLGGVALFCLLQKDQAFAMETYVLCGISFLAGFLGMIGFSAGVGGFNKAFSGFTVTYGAGLALTILAWLMNWGSVGVALIIQFVIPNAPANANPPGLAHLPPLADPLVVGQQSKMQTQPQMQSQQQPQTTQMMYGSSPQPYAPSQYNQYGGQYAQQQQPQYVQEQAPVFHSTTDNKPTEYAVTINTTAPPPPSTDVNATR